MLGDPVDDERAHCARHPERHPDLHAHRQVFLHVVRCQGQDVPHALPSLAERAHGPGVCVWVGGMYVVYTVHACVCSVFVRHRYVRVCVKRVLTHCSRFKFEFQFCGKLAVTKCVAVHRLGNYNVSRNRNMFNAIVLSLVYQNLVCESFQHLQSFVWKDDQHK